MNANEIKEVLNRIELCTAVIVDDEFHRLTYTFKDENIFGFEHPDSGEEYSVEVSEDAIIKDNKLVIDGTEYEFKILQAINIDPARVDVQYRNSFERKEIIEQAKAVMSDYDLIDEAELINVFKESISIGGCDSFTSVHDIISGIFYSHSFRECFKAKE